MTKIKYICGFLTLILFLHNCMQNPEIPEIDVEERIFQLVNEHRDSIGLKLLEWNNEISEQCRIHSINMATGAIPLGHDGFDNRINNIRQTIPLSAAGENIGYISGYTNPAVAIFNEWLSSFEHLKNIEGQYDLTGVGVAKNNNGDYYITQIFIKRDMGFPDNVVFYFIRDRTEPTFLY